MNWHGTVSPMQLAQNTERRHEGGMEQTNARNHELRNLQRQVRMMCTGMAGNFRDVQDVCPRTDSNMVMSDEGVVGSDGSNRSATENHKKCNSVSNSHEVVIRKKCNNMLADACDAYNIMG